MSEIRYPIKIASERSGVSAHLIRVWEKRYAALTPDRTETNRRLYSDAHIERLTRLFTCIQAGHRIGNIVTLPDEDLMELASQARVTQASSPASTAPRTEEPLPVDISDAYKAIKALDADALRTILENAAVAWGHQGLLTRLIMPLMQHVGRLWCEGKMTVADEHFATIQLRTYLLGQIQFYATGRKAPVILTATPTGQLHELGAVMAASAASSMGWQALHLGSCLPAAEIAGVAIRHQVVMVALSIVHPPDDPDLPGQLRTLRRLLPAHVNILASGYAAGSYLDTLDEIGAQTTVNLDQFYQILTSSRGRMAQQAAQN